jgi:hypothetical protein
MRIPATAVYLFDNNKTFKPTSNAMLMGAETTVSLEELVSHYIKEEANKRLALETFRRAKKGEQILVITQELEPSEEIDEWRGAPLPSRIFNYYLGILTGEISIDTMHNLVFQTEKHAFYTDSGFNGSWSAVNGRILLWFPYLAGFNSLPEENDFGKSVQVYIEEDVEKQFRKDEKPDTAYVHALRCIGLEAPNDFKAQYEKECREEITRAILEIEQLMPHNEMLKKRIEAVYASARTGGFIENGALTFVGDEGDAFFVSWAEREQLDRANGRIRGILGRAVELEAHKKEMRFELSPGIEVNVPRYIAERCKAYKVKVD